MLGANLSDEPNPLESVRLRAARLEHERWIAQVGFLQHLVKTGRIGGEFDGGAKYPEYLDRQGMAG